VTPWWYRTEFDVLINGLEQNARLHLDGINYEAEIWLNGEKIAERSEVRGMSVALNFSYE
jgi:exo-1,4-beta-D-glucosaminidase